MCQRTNVMKEKRIILKRSNVTCSRLIFLSSFCRIRRWRRYKIIVVRRVLWNSFLSLWSFEILLSSLLINKNLLLLKMNEFACETWLLTLVFLSILFWFLTFKIVRFWIESKRVCVEIVFETNLKELSSIMMKFCAETADDENCTNCTNCTSIVELSASQSEQNFLFVLVSWEFLVCWQKRV
jgi:hypothetical protein